MTPHRKNETVSLWTEMVNIPTYPVQAADPNPLFFEKRGVQGADGKIYPNLFTDRLSSEKIDREYEMVFLENEFIQVAVLPELGGRVFAGQDKTNHYDFFYRQRVIKPALIGLFGPWISGGVEFNWPQHHRPSTSSAVDWTLEEEADGSKTVWLSEHEPMNRTKGMVGICVHPGKAIVETKVRLYNRTPFSQNFLWWENAAVHINPKYEVFFPPDVHSTVFHQKTPVCAFPIATGTYSAGMDFGEGTDIRYYANFRAAASFFATESKYEFFGGYDHAKDAGTVHFANRFVSGGKKYFTWGNGPFGHKWQANLSDLDDPYLELMAGSYTDNQPDFSFIQPYETKTFSQFWYPIQKIGAPKNANLDVAINLETEGEKAQLGVYATRPFNGARVSLMMGGEVLFEKTEDLGPGKPMMAEVAVPAGMDVYSLLLQVQDEFNHELIRYSPEKPGDGSLPAPYKEPPMPQETTSVEELYLIGFHIEQYRVPNVSPLPYYEEALRRDPGESRTNNAMGLINLRQGKYARAEKYFRKAIERQTWRNFNPYDNEPYYNLGLTLRWQGRLDESYAAFYKAIWTYAWQSAGYYALSEVDCCRKDLARALDHIERSLKTNSESLKARGLKATILRHLGELDEAEKVVRETSVFDLLDFWSRNELVFILRAQGKAAEAEKAEAEVLHLMRNDAGTYLDLAFDYASAGFNEEAAELLERLEKAVNEPKNVFPMVYYTLGSLMHKLNKTEKSTEYYQLGSQAAPTGCLPWRLDELKVLEDALIADPKDARAHYYIGLLLYDKTQYSEAIRHWEISSILDPDFATTWRNLGVAAYNRQLEPLKAQSYYQTAFAKSKDARILQELDEVSRRNKVDAKARMETLEKNQDVVDLRDDLVLSLVKMHNLLRQPEKALEILNRRHFHPWEGGEGMATGQYSLAYWMMGREALEADRAAEAVKCFEQALKFPGNLGEANTLDERSDIYYYQGLANEAAGNAEAAKAAYQLAAEAKIEIPMAIYQYYKAIGCIKVGKIEEGKQMLEELLASAKQKLSEPYKPGYFNQFTPNAIFNDDLGELARTEALYQLALAQLGLGNKAQAKDAFRQVLERDPYFIEANEEFRRL